MTGKKGKSGTSECGYWLAIQYQIQQLNDAILQASEQEFISADLVVLPPFLQNEVLNEGDNIWHRQTLLARPQPLRPQYNDPELSKLQPAIP
jgi:hypothetical protein